MRCHYSMLEDRSWEAQTMDGHMTHTGRHKKAIGSMLLQYRPAARQSF